MGRTGSSTTPNQNVHSKNLICIMMHCPKTNLNLPKKTDPVTAFVASAPAVTGLVFLRRFRQFFLGQCMPQSSLIWCSGPIQYNKFPGQMCPQKEGGHDGFPERYCEIKIEPTRQ